MPMGVMSFRSWPRRIPEELDDYTMEAIDTGMHDIIKTFTGWLHCANDTYIYFNHTLIPRLLFSESDIQWRVAHNHYNWNMRTHHREFDLVFVNPGWEKWHNDTKNFPLACLCFPRLIDELGLKIMILGREPPDYLRGKIKWIKGMVDFSVLLDYFRRSKVLFVPAISDASPRIIPQALSMDTAIVVNRNIVGGWKYVNEYTGALFNDENDVVDVFEDVLTRWEWGELRPKESYRDEASYQAQRLQVFVEMMRKTYQYQEEDDDYKG